MAKSPKRILVATDCLSEGINLQDKFNAILHYDLPWNPNRLEQRFGRIHRIGQTEVCHLWNLVADDTREGDVYAKLLEKIEQRRRQRKLPRPHRKRQYAERNDRAHCIIECRLAHHGLGDTVADSVQRARGGVGGGVPAEIADVIELQVDAHLVVLEGDQGQG